MGCEIPFVAVCVLLGQDKRLKFDLEQILSWSLKNEEKLNM